MTKLISATNTCAAVGSQTKRWASNKSRHFLAALSLLGGTANSILADNPALFQRELSLRDAALMALENNPELEVERLATGIQEDAIMEAWGAFDPNFVLSTSWEERQRNLDQRSQNSVAGLAALFGGGEGDGEDTRIYNEENLVYQGGIQGITPWGMEYNLSLVNQVLENTSNTMKPEFVSEANLTIRQPLLKGWGLDYNLATVRLQKNRLAQQEFRLAQVVNNTLQSTMSAGLELIFAQQNIQVKADAIQLAEKLLAENRRRFEEGRMSEIDVLQAESRISEAREEEQSARIFHIERLNRLRELIYADANAAHRIDLRLSGYFTGGAPVPTRPVLLQAAKNSNPTYRAALKVIEERKISLDRAVREPLPELNLIAGVGYQGLDFDDNFGSLSDFADRDSPNVSVGLEFRMPLGNRVGQATKMAALKSRRQADYNLKQVENSLVTQLDQAIGTVRIAEERKATASQSVSLSTAALDAEAKRLENGRTTSFNVAEAQRTLSEARTRELAARIEYEIALVNLWAIVGQLGNRLNVQIQ